MNKTCVFCGNSNVKKTVIVTVYKCIIVVFAKSSFKAVGVLTVQHYGKAI